jgi:hypothetical protein
MWNDRTPAGNRSLVQLRVQSVFVRSVLFIKFVAGLTVKRFKNRNMYQAASRYQQGKKDNYETDTEVNIDYDE